MKIYYLSCYPCWIENPTEAFITQATPAYSYPSYFIIHESLLNNWNITQVVLGETGVCFVHSKKKSDHEVWICICRIHNEKPTLYLLDKIPVFLLGDKLSTTKEQLTKTLNWLIENSATTTFTGTFTYTNNGIFPLFRFYMRASWRPDPNSLFPFNKTFIMVVFLWPWRNERKCPVQSVESLYETITKLSRPYLNPTFSFEFSAFTVTKNSVRRLKLAGGRNPGRWGLGLGRKACWACRRCRNRKQSQLWWGGRGSNRGTISTWGNSFFLFCDESYGSSSWKRKLVKT